jgi:hypothetical protein
MESTGVRGAVHLSAHTAALCDCLLLRDLEQRSVEVKARLPVHSNGCVLRRYHRCTTDMHATLPPCANMRTGQGVDGHAPD